MADPINLASIYDTETPTDDEYLRRMRVQRDAILADCDWTHLTDAVVPDQTAWATYRQALRDAPATWTPGPTWTPPDPPA